MPPRKNPLQLNALQLKTLTLLQELARLPGTGEPADEGGNVAIPGLPMPHGDHFHLGAAVVASRDASGLYNPAVWAALERKGLVHSRAGRGPVLTPLGLGYETGMRGAILRSPAD
jgi:hypothetical protein